MPEWAISSVSVPNTAAPLASKDGPVHLTGNASWKANVRVLSSLRTVKVMSPVWAFV